MPQAITAQNPQANFGTPAGVNKKIQIDGWRNAVVRITGVLTGGDLSYAPAISLSDFINNDPMAGRNGKLIGFRIDYVWHSIGLNMELQIMWDATDPELIVAVSRSGKQAFDGDAGLQPNQALEGYTGGIDLFTTGYTPGTSQNFSVELGMVKLYS